MVANMLVNPSLFTATQEQLGLKLVPVFVIEKIESLWRAN